MTSTDEIVHILAVDDLPEKLLAMELILQQPGVQVVQARSGREALRRLLERDFAVVLLDVNMPDIDGFETVRLIRQRNRTRHTPIIFVTAFADEMHTARGYSLGAVDYILSPVNPEVLRTKVGVFVDLYRKNEQAKRQAEERVSLAREQAARAAAEEVTRRSLFLAEASTKLANSLDFEATRSSILGLVVPALADLAAVTLGGEHAHPWHTKLAWVSPGDGTIHTGSFDSTEGSDNELRTAVRGVLESGKPLVLDSLVVSYPPENKQLPTDQFLRTAFAIPLIARGRILGALTLARGASGQQFSPTDRALAEDLAGRAAVALDNARLYREVQEADRQKNEFLAMLAHELRNPLAPVRNAVQVLLSEGTSPRQQQWSKEVIARQVQQMVRMVDDLLDVSRITRGKITLRTEAVDLAAVVADAVETSRPVIDQRRQELTVSLPSEPVRAEGDATRLAQVVANLLNNAAKYTEEGGRIWLSMERAAGEVIVRIRDTGMGIAPEMLSRIFEPFAQADRSLDRSQGGLGIGLTLARRLIELHGGRISAHSNGPGTGSEFVVYLPALPNVPEEARMVNGRHPDAERPRTPLRILIIDDSVDGAESLAVLLQTLGLEVRTAYDGPSGLTAATEFRPEVVLLDIGLPRMDGYEVARRLRREPSLEGLLLIALSGYGQAEDRRRSREAGFDHHLLKPMALDVFLELIAPKTPNAALAESPQHVPGPR
jgi:signal transduction histidine kinase/DNA-binding response OmpR family regulator